MSVLKSSKIVMQQGVPLLIRIVYAFLLSESYNRILSAVMVVDPAKCLPRS